ncbi:hypothetical protein FACS189427_04350 [Planctomycetales bacterium]|nr:hypothetical protein FACS189427_04350 [Planctomycetales bacterium]
MPSSFFQYEVQPVTWFYLSALIILAIFFKFNRFWSIRNLDLIGLIMLTPGLLFLASGVSAWGYFWLFCVGGIISIRMVLDAVLVRRPLLEPNLMLGGLVFTCIVIAGFIVASIVVNRGERIDSAKNVRLDQLLTTQHLEKKTGINPAVLRIPPQELKNTPPGFLPFQYFSERTDLIFAPTADVRRQIKAGLESGTKTVAEKNKNNDGNKDINDNPNNDNTGTLSREIESGQIPASLNLLSEKSENNTQSVALVEQSGVAVIPQEGLLFLSCAVFAAVAGHILILCAFLYIGHSHFGSIRTGFACATLYLLHPYTNLMPTRLDHIIPAALILWGVAFYRRPVLSGFCIGTAAALVFYPIFLVPLWCSFYYLRGWKRFFISFVLTFAVFALLLFFSPPDLGNYSSQLLHLFGKSSFWIFSQPSGFWSNPDWIVYRIPVFAAFIVLCFGLLFWPAHKNYALLLSCSALLMLGVQFWQLYEGGLYISWYLPLAVLTIFRPNLEDRTAQTTVAAF